MSGRSAPVLGLDRALLQEVAVGDHARHLDHVAQLDLPPGAARGGPLQRRDEVAGLLAQRADALAQLADHLRELALRLPALALEAPDLALHPPELLLHRRHQTLDFLGASWPSRRPSAPPRRAALGHAAARASRRSARARPARSPSARRACARDRPRRGAISAGAAEQDPDDQQNGAHDGHRAGSRCGRSARQCRHPRRTPVAAPGGGAGTVQGAAGAPRSAGADTRPDAARMALDIMRIA